MKFDTIKNANYVATVVRVEEGDLYRVLGLDNLVGYSKFGMQALISRDTKPGLYILFSTEVQLSEKYAEFNNLYRDSTLNRDPAEKGYLESTRRVKAIKLKGNRSESLLMPLSSLAYVIDPDAEIREGDVFDSINGHEICRKYVPRGTKEQGANQPKARVRRVDERLFPQHIDTASYFRQGDTIPVDAHVTLTQKLHGTSVRFGNVLVSMPQKWWERLLRRPVRTEHKFVVGSRRVVKSVDGEVEGTKHHYYADDLWSGFAAREGLAERIPKDHLVYGELVGFTPDGEPIQKDYTYDCEPGETRLYVYRVALVGTDGHVVDMNHNQMRQFCNERGLLTVPVIGAGPHDEVDAGSWMDVRYYDDWATTTVVGGLYAEQPIPLSNKKTVDEGVVVRWDGPNGFYALKAKSPQFIQHETKMLDAEVEDLEAAA